MRIGWNNSSDNTQGITYQQKNINDNNTETTTLHKCTKYLVNNLIRFIA